ncbi:hypothetical protein PIROE2DRAFT_4377 [Piromyces sp. E2]|nr:hypothetical protein PIROE2DRAFT_4377 [Piromyces sp. E2]|eukprot:OUM68090.1 hypothetical protein PIROE2DRAFT_4377 [Piromyces sp. E2]
MVTSHEKEIIYIVTGGAGFLGGTVVRKLIESGKQVRTLVLPNDKSAKYIPKQVEIVEGDLRDMKSLEKLFSIPDNTEFVCLHIASIVTIDPNYNQTVMDVNVGGTKNIIKMCLTPKCRKMVYCSSTGVLKELPKGEKIKEADHFDENEVIGFYSQSKALATQAVLDAVKNDGLKASIVMPSGILGPEDYALCEITRSQIKIINGELHAGVDGSFNLCDVRDLADGLISAIENGRNGECYILANDEVKYRDFVTVLAEEAGTPPIKIFFPIWLSNIMAKSMEIIAKLNGTTPMFTTFSIYNLSRNNEYDSSKARKELGYRTRPFRETIKDEVQWFKDAGFVENKTPTNSPDNKSGQSNNV